MITIENKTINSLSRQYAFQANVLKLHQTSSKSGLTGFFSHLIVWVNGLDVFNQSRNVIKVRFSFGTQSP